MAAGPSPRAAGSRTKRTELARALIVGCGCRGRELAGRLAAEGWRIRGTSRTAAGVAAIEADGHDAARFDPDLPGNLLELVGDVAVVVWLLGSAEGDAKAIEAIHGPRLERLLEKLVDTPVRGFAYESVGSVPGGTLEGGLGLINRAAETWRIPVVFLERERDSKGWAAATAATVGGLLREGA